MSELDKMFEAIGHRAVSINRSVADGIWSARMCVENEQVVGLGREPAHAIQDALLRVLEYALERERATEDAAREARDVVAKLRDSIIVARSEGK